MKYNQLKIKEDEASDLYHDNVKGKSANDLYHDNVKKVGQKDYNDYKGIQIHNLRKELKRVRKILLNLQDIEGRDNSSDMVNDIRNMLNGYQEMIDNMESAFDKLTIGRHRTESVTIDKDDKLASLKVIDPNNRRHDDTLNEYSPKQIKMAFGILNDPRYRDGNYDGAYAAIEKLAKGLASHPSVAKALKRANESIIKEIDPSRSPWTTSGKHPGAMNKRELKREIAVFDELVNRGDHLSPKEMMQLDSLWNYLEGDRIEEDKKKEVYHVAEKAKWLASRKK